MCLGSLLARHIHEAHAEPPHKASASVDGLNTLRRRVDWLNRMAYLITAAPCPGSEQLVHFDAGEQIRGGHRPCGVCGQPVRCNAFGIAAMHASPKKEAT